MYKSIFLIGYILTSVLFCYSTDIRAQSYSFKHYASSDGLYPTALDCIFQDSHGYLWFGGNGGASKYDGEKFTTYLPEDVIVKDITEGLSGHILLATEGSGIAKLNINTGKLEWINSQNSDLPSDSVYSLLTDAQKRLWIGTSQGIIVKLPDGSKLVYNKYNALYGNWVRNIVKDKNGNIWASAGGLIKFSFIDGKILPEKIIKARILSLMSKKDGSIIWGTQEDKNDPACGIFIYKNGEVKKILDSHEYGFPIKTTVLYEDDSGKLYAGSTRGLFIFEDKNIKIIRKNNGLMNETVNGIIQDHEGALWFATDNGAAKLPVVHSVRYTETDGLKGGGILKIHIQKDNTIWAGGWAGLIKLKEGILTFPGEKYERAFYQIHSIAESADGTMWIGAFGSLFKYKNGKYSTVKVFNASNPFVTALTAGTDGSIWAGAEGVILNIKNDKVINKYEIGINEKTIAISDLIVDEKGRLWFGTYGEGIGYIYDEKITRFKYPTEIPNQNIYTFYNDSRNRMWITTAKGVVYYYKKKFYKPYFQNSRLNNYKFLSIVEDQNGNIWLGTELGVYCWKDSIIYHYDTRDGLASDCVHDIAFDNTGGIWFATSGGITHLSKKEIPVPIISIRGVTDYRSFTNVSPVELSYDERSLSFNIVSLSYFNENNMEFEYKLKGLKNGWEKLSRSRIVRYNALSPGSYTFMVRGKNRNGKWSKTASLNFTITPVYWQTWWFRITVSITLFVIFYSVYRYRIKEVNKEKEIEKHFSRQLIEDQENERKRIANELHDGLGQNLLIIKNRAHMGGKNPSKENVEKQLDIIYSLAGDSIDDVRKIAYNLHPYLIEEIGITRSIISMLNKFEESVPINFNKKIESIDNIFPSNHQINIYRIIQEAVNNIIKHSNATEALISIENKEGYVRIIIKDNGRGFSEAKVSLDDPCCGFGLKGINERVKYCGGSIDISSVKGEGTVINIIIPVSGYEKH